MTTPTYPSVTDELLKELDAAATDSKLNIYRPFGWAHSVRCGNHMQTDFDFLSLVSPETVLALTAELSRLRAENAELKRDAERYRFIRSNASEGNVDICIFRVFWGSECEDYTIMTDARADDAIDAAMEQTKC